jgi:biotin carboxylase
MKNRVLLIMRNTYGWNADHIEAMLRLGLEIHIATITAEASEDARFASVVPLPPELGLEETADYLLTEMSRLGLDIALTFYESDLVLTAMINTRLGAERVDLEAASISRDKRLQREFLARHGIPSARFAPVESADPVGSGVAAAASFAYPIIVKPTYLSASIGVALTRDETELRAALSEVAALAANWKGYFLADMEQPIALIEEFLPGKEVTMDGIALFGQFHVGGATNKMQMPGPYFDEDLYTLPFRTPEEEPELAAQCQAIIDGLGIKHCLFNAEFRQDADGRYRVIEFSIRLSGGQNYRNLREVYGLDLVRLYLKAVLGESGPDAEERVWAGEQRRQEPRAATCIKYAYRTGMLMRNNAGDVAQSHYFRSYLPAARPGARLRSAPEGWFEICGALAIATPYREPADIDRIERIAAELDRQLDIVVV